jgi:hypothetical protein
VGVGTGLVGVGVLEGGGVRDGVTGVLVVVGDWVGVDSSCTCIGVGVRTGAKDLQDMSKMAKMTIARFMAGIIAVEDEASLT